MPLKTKEMLLCKGKLATKPNFAVLINESSFKLKYGRA